MGCHLSTQFTAHTKKPSKQSIAFIFSFLRFSLTRRALRNSLSLSISDHDSPNPTTGQTAVRSTLRSVSDLHFPPSRSARLSDQFRARIGGCCGNHLDWEYVRDSGRLFVTIYALISSFLQFILMLERSNVDIDSY